MESKISLSAFAASMAQSMGKSKKQCEDFLREFFRLAGENLETGEPLKIKGFGTFKIVDVESRESVNVHNGERVEIAPYKKVTFTPSKELAALINAPFDSFESVEIDDEVPENIFFEDPSPVLETDPELTTVEPLPVPPPIPDSYSEEISNEATVSIDRLEVGSSEEGEDDDITLEAYRNNTVENVLKEPSMSPAETVPPIIPMPAFFENTVSPEPGLPREPEMTEPIKSEIMNDMEPEKSREERFAEFTQRRNRSREERLKPRNSQPINKKEERMNNSKFGIGFFTGAMTSLAICVIIFMLGCFFGWWPNLNNMQKVVVEEQPVSSRLDTEEPDYLYDSDFNEETSVPGIGTSSASSSSQSSSVVPSQTSTGYDPDAVYDTVTKTRYLTTIARENYGDFNFWPYIYLENESILGHPDRITPGTRVKVPSLTKYGVSPSNKADVQKAKQKAKEIYARFK